MVQALRALPAEPSRPRAVQGLVLIAVASGAAVLLDALVAAAPTRGLAGLLVGVPPDELVSRAHQVVIGAGLLAIAGGLHRRKRRAGLVMTLVLLIDIALTTTTMTVDRSAPTARLIVPVGALALMAAAWRELSVRGRPVVGRPLVGVGAFSAITAAAALAWWQTTDAGSSLGLTGALRAVTSALIGVDISRPGATTVTGPWAGVFLVLGAIGLLGGLALATAVNAPEPTTARQRARARDLIEQHGTDTLANFAFRGDRRYFFSSDGQVVVPYRYLARFAFVPAGPIGADHALDAAVAEFSAMCRRRGWGVAFVSLRESDLGRPGHQRRRHFYFGDEAVVSCSRFELAGKKNKSLRQSVQRVARDHEFAMIPEHDAGRALSTQLQAISAQWLDGAPERGFSMSLGLPVGHGPHDAELCVAFDEAGDPAGFLRMLPTPGSTRTFTLDLMRRKRNSPNGLNEFLIVRTIETLREREIDELSLNFATFGRLYQADRDLSVGERAIKAAVAPFNRFLPFQSLHEFNRRFRPEWVSRVLAYDHHGQLPFIAVVYFGLEGYLSLPLIGRFFEPDQTIDITRPIAMPARSDTTLEAIIGLRVAADGTIDLRDELLAVSDSHEGAHSDR